MFVEKNGSTRWRGVILALCFWSVLSVVMWVEINPIACLGVAVGGVVTVVALAVQAARTDPRE